MRPLKLCYLRQEKTLLWKQLQKDNVQDIYTTVEHKSYNKHDKKFDVPIIFVDVIIFGKNNV